VKLRVDHRGTDAQAAIRPPSVEESSGFACRASCPHREDGSLSELLWAAASARGSADAAGAGVDHDRRASTATAQPAASAASGSPATGSWRALIAINDIGKTPTVKRHVP
jgi:hypothetical protein